MSYLPVPPRVWSRVQNECSLNLGIGNSLNYARFDYERQTLLKGNILQYKKNSSNLTKNQRYSQIAKGMWTNRTTTYATQSDSYTNPNTNSLRRVNFTIVDPSNNVYSNPPNPFFAYGCPIDAPIKEGGSLICNTTVDPCTDVIINQTVSQKLCNPTTDSDVPGQIIPLCWNDGFPTWFPRQRYVMSTSGTKWPVNAKFIQSAIKLDTSIVLTANVTGCGNTVNLNWTYTTSTCIPITSFKIYQNNVLLTSVPFPETSLTLNELPGTYVFFVTAMSSNSSESTPSNTATVNTIAGYYTSGASETYAKNGYVYIVFRNNGSITFTCLPLTLDYTLVGGGASAGDCGNSTSSGAAGGGGQVLTKTSVSVPSLDTWQITIGQGGTNPIGSSVGGIGGDTNITSTSYNDQTNNGLYAGQGGQSPAGPNVCDSSICAGGGPVPGTSASGGVYNFPDFRYGTGGAGGNLNLTFGNAGQNNFVDKAGRGGDGQLGIDSNYYGGGGGGGGWQLGTGSYGGIGGGGYGTFVPDLDNPTPAPGTPNTGGGGGGGFFSSLPGNGGSGIVIFRFTL